MRTLIPHNSAWLSPWWEEDFLLSDKPFNQLFPRIDLLENEKEIVVKADLPAMDSKDIHLKVQDNQLIISGSQTQEKEDDKTKYHHRERICTEFHRVIRLPKEVDANKVKATMKQGVLQITMPKKVSEHQEIKIQVED
ncbi:MAG TPA: Hsp20/alpha crystallin family protein [Candidatus Gracilibacteria bacterium]|nr:Hsp20/alpha crystallin family protein [Candidatus Gracilibacteria bacterium]